MLCFSVRFASVFDARYQQNNTRRDHSKDQHLAARKSSGRGGRHSSIDYSEDFDSIDNAIR